MTGNDIRESFLRFFETKGHLRISSSSLIPAGDPTLLLTSAGMVPFKPYFTGELQPPRQRLTSVQKCFRATDIDSVGDSTHLTFFEMLGNFSVSDYFKEEAIGYAWEFVTGELDLPPGRLWATVYIEDTDAKEIWIRTGIPEKRIRAFGDDDNFWGPAGAEGPCGPCSELHYDFGENHGCKQKDCGPNCLNVIGTTNKTCDRFVELWNLVFMQYYKSQSGDRTPLPNPNIDTGMGLERCAAILQGKQNIYETDIFRPIIDKVSDLSNKKYGMDYDIDYAIRVVAEHARSATFLISDGVVPGNEGRGYVLRRVIRRAIRYGKKLGLNESFLESIGALVIEIMADQYPDLSDRQKFVLRVLGLEEERFVSVMYAGLSMLEGSLVPIRIEAIKLANQLSERNIAQAEARIADIVEKHDSRMPDWLRSSILDDLLLPIRSNDIDSFIQISKRLSGKEIFALSDTFGFPFELTEEIVRESNLYIDIIGFRKELEDQRNRARSASGKFEGDFDTNRKYQDLDIKATSFHGYTTLNTDTVVAAIFVGTEQVGQAAKGQIAEIVLLETPFYAEMGGQTGDTGTIIGERCQLEVIDTQSPISGLTIHKCNVSSGNITLGDNVTAIVESHNRADTARNHTATHLLHSALRAVLGAHVRQHGSLVASDRLRFDFTHVSAITTDELDAIQNLVNQKIRENIEVSVNQTTYRQAVSDGAIAFFGDRYGDSVRVIEVGPKGNQPFSLEVCGGTHVHRTGELGYCHIISENSIGAGLRRIEAVTGRSAEILIQNLSKTLDTLSLRLQSPIDQILSRTDSMIAELDHTRKSAIELERQLLKQDVNELQVIDLDGINIAYGRLNVSSTDLLREAGDWLRNRIKTGIIVVGTVLDQKPILMIMSTKDVTDLGFHAGNTVSEAAIAMDGKGGGRPDMAQAGGDNPDKLDNALQQAKEVITKWRKTLG